MADTPLRVVLGCDTANEIDGQFAIAYGLGSPALDAAWVFADLGAALLRHTAIV